MRYHPVPHKDRVPRGTGYLDEEQRFGTVEYSVPGSVQKLGNQGLPGTGFLVPCADP